MESFPIPGTRGRLDGAGSLILLSCDVGRPRRSLLSKGRRALALCGCGGGRRPSGPARRRARTRAAGGARCRLRCGSSRRSDPRLDALPGRVRGRSLDDLAGSLANRTSVPASKGTDDDTISASVDRSAPVTCNRSGPILPSTSTGTLVTYSLRRTWTIEAAEPAEPSVVLRDSLGTVAMGVMGRVALRTRSPAPAPPWR